jgi:rod shape-determining protein MreC
LSAVPAITQRTRSRSTVKGTGDTTRAKLEYVQRTDDLQEGDVLITAGGSGIFPQGLRIGRVTNVGKKPVGLFLTAEVAPAVDFSRLDEVEVVVAAPPPLPPSDNVAATGTVQ